MAHIFGGQTVCICWTEWGQKIPPKQGKSWKYFKMRAKAKVMEFEELKRVQTLKYCGCATSSNGTCIYLFISYLLNKSLYLHSTVGIVDKDIQSSILFFVDLIKQLLDFFIISMVTLHRYTLSSTLLSYLKKINHWLIRILAGWT